MNPSSEHPIAARQSRKANATANYAPLCACGRPASATVSVGTLRASVCATCYHGAHSGTTDRTPAQLDAMRVRLKERAAKLQDSLYWAIVDRERYRQGLAPVAETMFPRAYQPGRVTLADIQRIASYSQD